MHHDHPELLKDQYWDEGLPTELPYTVASMSNNKREEPPEASTANIEVKQAGQEIMTSMPSGVKIDEMVKTTQGMDYQFPENRNDSDSDNNEKTEVRSALVRWPVCPLCSPGSVFLSWCRLSQ